MKVAHTKSLLPCGSMMRRIARDTSGNTLMIVAGALLPLLAMVGGALDIGRGYLVHARLQQACDAGVLAARQSLGSEVAVTGEIPEEMEQLGVRFFNTNFATSVYGSTTREFDMQLEEDYAISGTATSRVPTTLMGIFGQDFLDISANCSAQLNMQNTDVVMALDVTGSMALTNPGDSQSRMAVLRSVLSSFHQQLDAAAGAGARIRYGFVPYSTNVNVGHLLEDDWVADEWRYSSRRLLNFGTTTTKTSYTASSPVSGTYYDSVVETYSPGGGQGNPSCGAPPASTVQTTNVITETKEQTVIGPPAGTKKTETFERTRDGESYSVSLDSGMCVLTRTTYIDYIDTFDRITEPTFNGNNSWLYAALHKDTSNWRSETEGCMEERQTYEITDYDNVDFTRALDLNIDLVPTDNPVAAGVTVSESLTAESNVNLLFEETFDDGVVTKWRPMYPQAIFGRAKRWDGNGNFTSQRRISPHDFISPYSMYTDACPPPSLNLQTLTSGQLDTYLSTLVPSGSTYHDIGMIWAGRMISPTGLFAAQNADVGTPTSRNVIFLTDGETSPLDISYGAYGFEPVDQRRWSPNSALSLTEVVENRFGVACDEVRKRGVTVWIVGFGTELSETMRQCAGEGHYFEAADAVELNLAFGEIASTVTELRIVR